MINTISSKRKGISTILGAIFFVGILFSAYVPMMLVMKQADTIYEQVIHETRMEDEFTYDETLLISAISRYDPDNPGNYDKNAIDLYINNLGDNLVHVVAIWFNDVRVPVDCFIDPNEIYVFIEMDIPVANTQDVEFRITTSNGNVFSSETGSLIFDSQYGWYTPTLAIVVTVINDSGQFKINVTNWDESHSGSQRIFGEYISSGNEHGDISKTFLLPRGLTHDFNVTVRKRGSTSWDKLLVMNPIEFPLLVETLSHM